MGEIAFAILVSFCKMEHTHILLTLIFTCFMFNTSFGSDPRKSKVFSLFNVVRFPNSACAGTSDSQTGTCLTSSECTTKVIFIRSPYCKS